MANVSSASHLSAELVFFFSGSLDHAVGIVINCWALWLIVSGKHSTIASELLTLNLLTVETFNSFCFFLSLIKTLLKVSSLVTFINFHRGMSVAGRAMFQCHVCVDRYLAVVHPMVFIRYKQLRCRGTCLAAVWLVVVCCGLTNAHLSGNITMLSFCSGAILAPALFIELFCSLSIVRILRRPKPGSKAQEKKEGDQQKKRAVRIIGVVLGMLVFNVVPFIVFPLFTKISIAVWSPIAMTFATFGSSTQAFLFLSRAGVLACKR
ncbi:G-protein coupled receptor 20-like [Pungitius pungitius]|uniref:G-protein coupled receptor 20-like n=1 Tax=Pungitius pungitius TaxID=134920 RepID=UPI002E118B02